MTGVRDDDAGWDELAAGFTLDEHLAAASQLAHLADGLAVGAATA